MVVASNRYEKRTPKHAKGWLESGVTRRTFMKMTGAFAAGTAVGHTFFRENQAKAMNFGDPTLVETDENVAIKYSVCLACHSACGIRCKVVDGVLVKIDGNPYHPNCLESHVPYDTAPEVAKLTVGKNCAKSQAGIQVVYNPFRIKEPLKRVGARGSGQWETIPWSQAFSEIGAQLNALRDLDTPLASSDTHFGPLANKVIFSGGRNQHGQMEFTDRFWGNCFGTVNKRHDHSSVSHTSHHVGYALATGNGAFGREAATTGSTDLPNCEFVLWFGSDPMSANFPFVPQARKLGEMISRGGRVAVVDPRCSVAASKANWWLPIRPGTDAALAMAIGRFILDNNLYNTGFLQRPHDAAANATGELNTTDATFLVKIGGDGHAGAYLRADEAGIAGGTSDDFVVWSGGAAAQYDTVDTADLLPGMVLVNGINCKTAFELYAEQARSRTIAEWSTICDIDGGMIAAIAMELTSHGRSVSVEHYRGSVQHTNGTYTSWSIINLNTLLGNCNWKGGHVFGGGHWHEMGGRPGNRFSPADVVNGVSDSGVQVTRVKVNYEDTTEFASNGYPARRPWFPFANHYNYQEIIPSIEDEYPYPVGALILYWNNIAYSTPAGKAAVQRVLANEAKVPLIVSIDIEMGETTAWADYVLPDTTYLERWSTPHVASAINTTVSGIRQPVLGTLDENGDYTPFLPNTKMLEDILIGLGKAMGLPMDLKDQNESPTPLDKAWDWHSQLISNVADEDGGVPGATPDERRDYVLARGGRFEGHDAVYNGDTMAHRYETRLYFYNEQLGQTRDSMTGELFDGSAKFAPVADLLGNDVVDNPVDYPFHLVTYKKAWHSQARTICNPWLVSIQPENFVEMNSVDAAPKGIRTGDQVLVTSASHASGSVGRAYVTSTIRPGVVAVAHGFGHWEMSSKPYTVNGVETEADSTRAAGIATNPIMRTDPVKSNVTLQDKVGGSAACYDTRVQVTKV